MTSLTALIFKTLSVALKRFRLAGVTLAGDVLNLEKGSMAKTNDFIKLKGINR